MRKIIKLEWKSFYRQKKIRDKKYGDNNIYIFYILFAGIAYILLYALKNFNVNDSFVYVCGIIFSLFFGWVSFNEKSVKELLKSKNVQYMKMYPCDTYKMISIKMIKTNMENDLMFLAIWSYLVGSMLTMKYRIGMLSAYYVLGISVFLVAQKLRKCKFLKAKSHISFFQTAKTCLISCFIVFVYGVIAMHIEKQEIVWKHIKFPQITIFGMWTAVLLCIGCVFCFAFCIERKWVLHYINRNQNNNVPTHKKPKMNKVFFANAVEKKDINIMINSGEYEKKRNRYISYIINIVITLTMFRLLFYDIMKEANNFLAILYMVMAVQSVCGLFSEQACLGNDGRMILMYLNADYSVLDIIKEKIKYMMRWTIYLCLPEGIIISIMLQVKFINMLGLLALMAGCCIYIVTMNVATKSYKCLYFDDLKKTNIVAEIAGIMVVMVMYYIIAFIVIIFEWGIRGMYPLFLSGLFVFLICNIGSRLMMCFIKKKKRAFYGEYQSIV